MRYLTKTPKWHPPPTTPKGENRRPAEEGGYFRLLSLCLDFATITAAVLPQCRGERIVNKLKGIPVPLHIPKSLENGFTWSLKEYEVTGYKIVAGIIELCMMLCVGVLSVFLVKSDWVTCEGYQWCIVLFYVFLAALSVAIIWNTCRGAWKYRRQWARPLWFIYFWPSYWRMQFQVERIIHHPRHKQHYATAGHDLKQVVLASVTEHALQLAT